MSSVFVFLLIFLCASMEFHYAFTSSSSNLTHIPPASLAARVFVSNYFSSPRNFHKHFFPWQQRKSSFFVFCRFLRRNLFFTSRCKRRWNGGSLDTQPRLESSLFMRRARASATQGRIYRKRRALTLAALV